MFEGNSYNIELCHTYDLTISEGLSRTEAAWIQAMCEAESTYFGLLTEGEPAQQARNVLPLALKTELIMTGTVEQWIEFLKLRCAMMLIRRQENLQLNYEIDYCWMTI